MLLGEAVPNSASGQCEDVTPQTGCAPSAVKDLDDDGLRATKLNKEICCGPDDAAGKSEDEIVPLSDAEMEKRIWQVAEKFKAAFEGAAEQMEHLTDLLSDVCERSKYEYVKGLELEIRNAL